KRVRVTRTFASDFIPPLVVSGVVVGFVQYAKGYEHFACMNEVLLLQDGFDEPDFIVFDDLSVIG
ncbi:hypothetical protein C0120_08545, partial [Moraxella catarrhalis]|uniref:hypothetical protein n=1 Tax=Moraxella catarrhalis TaxID=480 RepID=UPI0018837021